VVFAAMRRLAVIAAAVTLVGFAFEPEAQLRFTATLLGALAILYLLALLGVWVWHRMGRPHPRLRAQVAQPSALEFAHHDFADEEAHVTVVRQAKAAKDVREQEEHTARARDLERQGAFSLWSRP
jgi:uncharacterized membrane protein YcjF (UPF0283 family)